MYSITIEQKGEAITLLTAEISKKEAMRHASRIRRNRKFWGAGQYGPSAEIVLTGGNGEEIYRMRVTEKALMGY